MNSQIGSYRIHVHGLARGANHLDLPGRSRILGVIETDSGIGVTVMEPEMSMSTNAHTILLVRDNEEFWPSRPRQLRHLGDISLVDEDTQHRTSWHAFEESK